MWFRKGLFGGEVMEGEEEIVEPGASVNLVRVSDEKSASTDDFEVVKKAPLKVFVVFGDASSSNPFFALVVARSKTQALRLTGECGWEDLEAEEDEEGDEGGVRVRELVPTEAGIIFTGRLNSED